MKNPIQLLEERVEALERELSDVSSTASSAKARVIILQEVVKILRSNIRPESGDAKKLNDLMAQL